MSKVTQTEHDFAYLPKKSLLFTLSRDFYYSLNFTMYKLFPTLIKYS
jgi:hypothetical protein